MFYLKILTWLIWLQNRSLSRDVILYNLIGYHWAITPALEAIKLNIELGLYDEAEELIDTLRYEYGEFAEATTLQTRIDVIPFLDEQGEM